MSNIHSQELSQYLSNSSSMKIQIIIKTNIVKKEVNQSYIKNQLRTIVHNIKTMMEITIKTIIKSITNMIRINKITIIIISSSNSIIKKTTTIITIIKTISNIISSITKINKTTTI
jgi:hypothetical protein